MRHKIGRGGVERLALKNRAFPNSSLGVRPPWADAPATTSSRMAAVASRQGEDAFGAHGGFSFET